MLKNLDSGAKQGNQLIKPLGLDDGQVGGGLGDQVQGGVEGAAQTLQHHHSQHNRGERGVHPHSVSDQTIHTVLMSTEKI